MMWHAHAKAGLSKQFQWPPVSREQVLLLNLALAKDTSSHSLAPQVVKLEVHDPLPPGNRLHSKMDQEIYVHFPPNSGSSIYTTHIHEP